MVLLQRRVFDVELAGILDMVVLPNVVVLIVVFGVILLHIFFAFVALCGFS